MKITTATKKVLLNVEHRNANIKVTNLSMTINWGDKIEYYNGQMCDHAIIEAEFTTSDWSNEKLDGAVTGLRFELTLAGMSKMMLNSITPVGAEWKDGKGTLKFTVCGSDAQLRGLAVWFSK